MAHVRPNVPVILELMGGMTQEALASRSGIPRRSLQRILSATKSTSYFNLQKLARYFGVPTATLTLPEVEASPMLEPSPGWLELAESSTPQDSAIRDYWRHHQRFFGSTGDKGKIAAEGVELFGSEGVMFELFHTSEFDMKDRMQGLDVVRDGVEDNYAPMTGHRVRDLSVASNSQQLILTYKDEFTWEESEQPLESATSLTLTFREGRMMHARVLAVVRMAG